MRVAEREGKKGEWRGFRQLPKQTHASTAISSRDASREHTPSPLPARPSCSPPKVHRMCIDVGGEHNRGMRLCPASTRSAGSRRAWTQPQPILSWLVQPQDSRSQAHGPCGRRRRERRDERDHDGRVLECQRRQCCTGSSLRHGISTAARPPGTETHTAVRAVSLVAKNTPSSQATPGRARRENWSCLLCEPHATSYALGARTGRASYSA